MKINKVSGEELMHNDDTEVKENGNMDMGLNDLKLEVNEKKTSIKEGGISPNQKTGKYICEKCSSTYSLKKSLQKHYRTKHPDILYEAGHVSVLFYGVSIL